MGMVMETKTPPQGFKRSLQLLDDQLGVRWGEILNQWVIDRKAYLPDSEIQFLRRRKARTKTFFTNPPAGATAAQKKKQFEVWQQVSEELASARKGRRIIIFTKTLSPEIYNALCAADIKRYGGFARFADDWDKKEENAEAEAERVLGNKRHAMNQEIADQLHFVWRKRDTDLLHGNRDLRQMLHGKKTTPDSQPLIQLTDF